MICSECVSSFFLDPIKLTIFSLAVVLSITCLITLKTRKDLSVKKQISLIYAHLFLLAFPVVFYLLFRGCQKVFNECSQIHKVALLIGLTTGISLLFGLVLAPFLYVNRRKTISAKTGLDSFLSMQAKRLGINRPHLVMVDDAKPFAFSNRKHKIYMSLGLSELLTKKEQQAVLLHELYHLKEKTPWYRFSLSVLRVLSPLAHFTSFAKQLNNSEAMADKYAINIQNTAKHLTSAKNKINSFITENAK